MKAKDGFSKAKIRDQLNLILAAPAFKNSNILSGFLKFVTEETLAGRGSELKEYTIGINALSRKVDFNPQLDAIVRIHAGRLRRALKEYYFVQGKNDLIVIEIPKGGYIPIFLLPDIAGRPVVEEPLKPNHVKPIVAVLPFRNISRDSSRDYFADGLGEQLSTELTFFNDLSVISYYSSRHIAGMVNDVKEIAKLLSAKYLLTGSIQSDHKDLRVRVQLISGERGEQLWAKSYERHNTAAALFEIQNEIVRNILTAIGGYYGAIFRDVLKSPNIPGGNGIEKYDAIFWYYHYQKVFTSDVLRKTISALEAVVKSDPEYALAWAMLGELYLDDKVMECRQIDNPLEAGLNCALRAVKIDPNCQHAYQALAWAYLFHHEREKCLEAIDKCLAINPNASNMAGGMGFGLVCAGEFDRGFKLLSDSIQHNPYCPWWFNAGFVFYHLYKKDYQQAKLSAEKINMPDLLWDPLLKAASFGHLDAHEEAARHIDLLLHIIPEASFQVKDMLASFLLSPELNQEILEGLNRAGLQVVIAVREAE